MYLKSIVFIFTVFSACNQTGNESGKKEISGSDLKEPLIEVNKQRTGQESRLIDKYVERRGWEMKETGTGLRYMIYNEGNGSKAEKGLEAIVKYQIFLLDGTLCYETKGDENKSFIIGKDNVESGIHEGITYLRVGDKAKFILPSHLAHGLTGDLNKIPPRSSLVVDLELLALR